MTLPHTCPFCGSPTEVPQLFTRTRQAIFFHIWDNPGCTLADIANTVYPALGKNKAIDTVSTHLSHIRRGLDDGVMYQLFIINPHNRPHRYKITHAKPSTSALQESVNGTNQHNRRIP